MAVVLLYHKYTTMIPHYPNIFVLYSLKILFKDGGSACKQLLKLGSALGHVKLPLDTFVIFYQIQVTLYQILTKAYTDSSIYLNRIMADDPNRDILPVKDCCEYNIPTGNHKILSSVYEDVVQRQCTSKLARSDLEDRYLRLCDENIHLKKLCNKQHEKIKRLATKLLRVVSERKRAGGAGLMLGDQQGRISQLENTNDVLQDRLLVLKSQLVSHSRLHSAAHCNCSRSPSRSPVHHASRPASRNEPGKTRENMRKGSPVRSKRIVQKAPSKPFEESHRQKDQNEHKFEEVELLRNQMNIMEQDMEIMREESNSQITTLERQLAQDKRKQVTDNIEVIRLKRSLNQQSIQLAALQEQNIAANRDVAAIQDALEQAHKENDNLHDQLLKQKQKYLELQQEMLKVHSTMESSNELKQTLADLKQEKCTLKSHNDRLLELSASAQALEIARCQQMNERDSNLRSQLTDVQTSLTGLLSEKDLLKRALQEETNTVSCLRQAHQQLLSKFWDLQNLYHLLEKQLGSLKTGEDEASSVRTIVSSERVPSLEQTRDVLKPLLQPTDGVPYFDETNIASMRRSVEAMGLSHEFPLDYSLDPGPESLPAARSRADSVSRTIEAIIEHPSLESRCSCASASALSCTCCASRSSTGLVETQPAREASVEVELMSKSMSSASHSAILSSDSEHHADCTILKLDKATDPMSKQSLSLPQSNHPRQPSDRPRQPLDQFAKSGDLAIPERSPSTDQDVPAPTGDEGSGRCRPSVLDPNLLPAGPGSQTANVPTSISGIVAHTTLKSTGLRFDSDDRPPTIDGCLCCSGVHAQKTSTNVPVTDPVRTCEARSPSMSYNILDLQYSSGEVSEAAAKSSSDSYMANYLDAPRELQKCRELLRVQCNLNGLYKQELAKMREQMSYTSIEKNKLITTMCRTRERPTPNIPQQKVEKPRFEPDLHLPQNRTLLRVGFGQGLFELHAGYMQLSTEGCERLCRERSMFLTWKFYDQDLAYTPPKVGAEAQFDCSAVYRVQVDKDFLQYIQNEHCTINLHVSVDDKSELIAHGYLSFVELLDFPQNKLNAIVQLKSTRPDESSVVCGVLQCWYRLSCDVNLVSRPKDDSHNGVQFDDTLHIKTLTPLLGSPLRLDSVETNSFAVSLPRTEEDDEALENSNEQLSEDDNSAEVTPFPPVPMIDIDSFSSPDEPMKQPLKQEPPPTKEQPYTSNTFKSIYLSDKSSLTFEDSSYTSVSEEVKSDSLNRVNSKDLTLFQKRMLQLRKGLYSESSTPDLDDVETGTSRENHMSVKSEDSVDMRVIPSNQETGEHNRNLLSNGEVPCNSKSPVQSRKDMEALLSSEIQRSKEMVIDSEARDVLEVLDMKNWNRRVHSSNSIASEGEAGSRQDEDHPALSLPPQLKVRPIVEEKESQMSTENPPKESPPADNSQVTVEIHWMTLDPESTPLKNPEVVQLYVEFTFLGMRGSELETAMSLPTPATAEQKLVFNYSKDFNVAKATHQARRKELKKLLSRASLEHSIHFIVISEPLPEDSNTTDCEEIGQASVNIQTMMLERRDYDPINVAILSVDGRQENIGNLNVSVRGVNTLIEICAEDDL